MELQEPAGACLTTCLCVMWLSLSWMAFVTCGITDLSRAASYGKLYTLFSKSSSDLIEDFQQLRIPSFIAFPSYYIFANAVMGFFWYMVLLNIKYNVYTSTQFRCQNDFFFNINQNWNYSSGDKLTVSSILLYAYFHCSRASSYILF